MKKVIGIYCGDFRISDGNNWDSDYVRENGAGGSETWAVEIASAFARKGFHVIVFGCPDTWHFDKDGVEYVPYYLFESRIEYQHFDYFISSRRAEEISDKISCDNIYIMSHEIGIFNGYWGNFETYEGLKMNMVKKIGVLSEWHKEAMMNLYPQLSDDRLFLTFNGIDQKLYSENNYEKRNMMVWSSCLCRGLRFFSKFVFPKIKSEIPDFEVNICSYNTDIYSEIPSGDGFNFLGTLDKASLAELQKQAKIWILPNYGRDDFGRELHESFCITAVENAMAGNAIVCLNKDGLTTTLNGYSGILNADFFDEFSDYSDADLESVGSLIASSAIDILKNDELRLSLAIEAKSICVKYNWDSAVETWLDEWQEGSENVAWNEKYDEVGGYDGKYILVCCAKKENSYIKEFVKHYLDLGFDKIVIGDNNDDRSLEGILSDEVKDGLVDIYDCHGMKLFMADFYSFFSMAGGYEWAFYADCDEFLELNAFDDIKKFVKSKGDDITHIEFNWVTYANCGKIEAEDEGVQERFRYPLPLACRENLQRKSMISGKVRALMGIHTFDDDIHKYEKYVGYKDGYLKHYKHKSIEEQVIHKKRGSGCMFNYELPIIYYPESVDYHRLLIDCDDIRKFEREEIILKYKVAKFIIKNDVYSAVRDIIRSMTLNKEKIYYIDGNIDDHIFNILFEYALHTENKVCIVMPEIKDFNIYEIYEY